MAEYTEPTSDETDDAPEVEAHSILDYQSLGKDIDRSGMWTCLSNISSANEE
jgi:hypothetical protein